MSMRYDVAFTKWLLAKLPRTHRHIKRRSTYTLLWLGRAQADKPIHDDERVAIYVGEYGDLWARRLDEFDRSRFERIEGTETGAYAGIYERYRQIRDEGFDSEYDAHYENSQLALAAAAYALSAAGVPDKPTFWPWAQNWWKPKTPRRDLERAVGLLMAELDRLDKIGAD